MKNIMTLASLILLIRVTIGSPTLVIHPDGTYTVTKPVPQVTVINTLKQDILNSIHL